MAISYPLSLPTSIGLANITLTGQNTVAVSSSPFTGQQQVLKYPRECWKASVTVARSLRDNAEDWVAFMLALRGQYGTFFLNDPLNTTPQGAARSTDTVTISTAVSSGESISIDSDQNSITDYLKAGDYISTGSGTSTQLFKVLNSVDTNSTGGATLDVWPRVRTSLSVGDTVTVENCKGVFRMATNDASWGIETGNAYQIQFEAMEAL